MVREVIFYKTSTGRSPVEEFFDTLSSKQAQKVAWVLNLVEELDMVPTPYFHKIPGTDDLWEVRAKAGSNIFRLLGFLTAPSWLSCLHSCASMPR